MAENILELCINLKKGDQKIKLTQKGKIACINSHFDFYYLIEIVQSFIEENPDLETFDYSKQKEELFRKYSGINYSINNEGAPIDLLPQDPATSPEKYFYSNNESSFHSIKDHNDKLLDSILKRKTSSLNLGRIFDDDENLIYEGQTDLQGQA